MREFADFINDDLQNYREKQYESSLNSELALDTREVSTIAGSAFALHGTTDGIGGNARFNQPRGLVIIGNDLYVTDALGTAIRHVSLSNFGTTTVVGLAGSAGAVDDFGIAARIEGANTVAAASGKLFFVHQSTLGATLRRYDPETTKVETVAGSLTERKSVDGDKLTSRFTRLISLTSDGVNLWIPDVGTYLMRKFRPETGQLSTVFGVSDKLMDDHFAPIESASVRTEMTYVPGIGFIAPRTWTSVVFK